MTDLGPGPRGELPRAHGGPGAVTPDLPETTEALLSHLESAALLVTADGSVAAASTAARRVLGVADPRGFAVDDIIPDLVLVAGTQELPATTDGITRSVVVEPTADGWLVLLSDPDGALSGWQQPSALHHMAVANEQSPIGMAIVSLDGDYLEVNDALCRIAQRTSAQMLAINCRDLMHPDEAEADTRMLADLATGRVFECNRRRRIMRPDGSWTWVQFYGSVVLDAGGGVSCIAIHTFDISEHVAAEEARQLAEESARRAVADLSYRSSHDMLTGLLNRRALLSALDRLLPQARRAQEGLAVLFCDLDNLKEINDGVSHEAGDAILIQLADSLRHSLRSHDLVGRVGGDEFVVVLRDIPEPDLAATIAEQIRSRAERGLSALAGLRVATGVSIGVRIDDGSASAAQLLRDADVALHRAKSSGRNQIVVFDHELQAQVDWLRNARTEVAAAIEAGDIHGWFQPVVDLAERTVVGYEGLARWVRDGTALDAGNWLTAIVDTPLIARIGQIVIRDAIAFLATLPEDVWVAVNVSAREIGSPAFVKDLLKQLERNGVVPERFIVEVTESVVMDRTTVRQQLDALVAAGLQLHFDDFGTGYASLNHLHLLPVSGVKLDRQFTEGLSYGRVDSLAIVRGIAGLAEQLGLAGVAEGIESEEQARVLQQAGWRLGQGYLFGAAAAPHIA